MSAPSLCLVLAALVSGVAKLPAVTAPATAAIPAKTAAALGRSPAGARGSFAIAGVTNRSQYTRFSSDGGGQLDGFEEGEPGQYRVNQLLEDLAWKRHGLSLQHEGHWKEVEDRLNGDASRFVGGYLQFGAFLHRFWTVVPRQLEVAARVAYVEPEDLAASAERTEVTLGTNWFFLRPPQQAHARPVTDSLPDRRGGAQERWADPTTVGRVVLRSRARSCGPRSVSM